MRCSAAFITAIAESSFRYTQRPRCRPPRRAESPARLETKSAFFRFRRSIPARPSKEVVISKEVVEGTARPLYIYADRADRTGDASAS
jgi:hypothetical protein